jgi:lipooligosaccharide transport system permease protein
MIFSCLGTICGTTIDKPENLGRVQAVIIVPLIFMAGIFFPLSSYPAYLQPVIGVIPTTAIFEGARLALLKGEVDGRYAGILMVTAVVAFALAVFIFNRKIED